GRRPNPAVCERVLCNSGQHVRFFPKLAEINQPARERLFVLSVKPRGIVEPLCSLFFAFKGKKCLLQSESIAPKRAMLRSFRHFLSILPMSGRYRWTAVCISSRRWTASSAVGEA